MAERLGSEDQRLQEARELAIPWKKWGPYVSERQELKALGGAWAAAG